MNTGYYRFAGHTAEIRSLYADVHHLCRDYAIAPQAAEIVVETTPADLEFERVTAQRMRAARGFPVRESAPGELESLAVYRRLVQALLKYDVLLFHGSAVAADGEGYLFIAPSGTGKSTQTRLWRELLGARAVMVNDDKPLLQVSDAGVTVYGTPWDGKHRLSSNIAVPLRAICVLERASENRIRAISPVEAYPFLVRQSYRYESENAERRALALLELITQHAGLYRLGCDPTPAAAELAWTTMRPGDADA